MSKQLRTCNQTVTDIEHFTGHLPTSSPRPYVSFSSGETYGRGDEVEHLRDKKKKQFDRSKKKNKD